MKKYIYSLLIGTAFLFTSCEEVIELDLDQYEKRVVIDANMFMGENLYNKIKIYYSAPFYANGYEYISTAQVTIKEVNTSNEYTFNYTENGYYENTTFNPSVNSEYELNVQYNGVTYIARSYMTQAPEILDVVQINDSGFDGKSSEIRFYYQDQAGIEDFYLTQLISTDKNNISVSDDKFSDGNLVFDVYFAEEDEQGETISYSLAKIDKNYYNYLYKLISNSAASGNPFSTPTGTLRGNITNTTNPNNFPLGYFNIAKRNSVLYTIE